jgi:hypothetical protein
MWTFLGWSAALLAVGALVALRGFGVATSVAWTVAASASILSGFVSLFLAAPKLAGDPKSGAKMLMMLPAVRMALAGFFGWLFVGPIAQESREAFWMSLVISYLATLALESALLMRLLQRPAAQAAFVDRGGAI